MSNTEPPAKKRKRGIETAWRILEVSAGLFAQRGYDSVSVREIALHSGVKESSIYNHFTSKYAILETLLEHFAGNISASRPSAEELDALVDLVAPEEVFRTIILSVGRTIDSLIRDIARIIYTEMYRNDTAAKLYQAAIVSEPATFHAWLIEKMISKGKLRQCDAKVVADSYNSALVALTIEHTLAGDDALAARAVVKKMMAMAELFCGLLRP